MPNALNQYDTVNSQASTFDKNGNLLTWFPLTGKATYAYDSENRLVSAAVNGSATASIFYDYNGLGRRVSKTVGSVTTAYLLNGDEEIAEYSGPTLLRRFIDGRSIDERIARAEGSAVSNPTKIYYHTNHQSSALAIADAGGSVSRRAGYDEYGRGAGLGGEPFGFAGRRFDPETGLYYYRARYYSPVTGRFLQTDPVGYSDDYNLYAFVGNDPADRNDPSGKSILEVGV